MYTHNLDNQAFFEEFTETLDKLSKVLWDIGQLTVISYLRNCMELNKMQYEVLCTPQSGIVCILKMQLKKVQPSLQNRLVPKQFCPKM